ncbi:baseplate J/gp47 family protein [Candidatus Woesebacteria bacterium]|nr:baseplate J/gp47 family protein [Candidatus Woesebacteria bacterium]
MSIKDILPKKEKKEKVKYYWTLIIEPGWLQTGIWKIEEGSAHILVSSLSTPWNSDADLISTSDIALSSAVKKLDQVENEPNQTVFGVVSSWVEDGEIKEEHLMRVKNLCEKLDLQPVGFVVIPEAIAHFMKSQEGSPLNALILGVFEEEIEITVFNLGEIATKGVVSRSVSVIDDLGEGFARLNITKMPARFIIYGGKEGELEIVRQSLLKTNWEDLTDIEILHIPKIEIMDSEKKISAVSLAGASELSDVQKIVSHSKDNHQTNLSIEENDFEVAEEANLIEPEEQISPENFGFVVEEDITEKEFGEEKTYDPKELDLDEDTKKIESVTDAEETRDIVGSINENVENKKESKVKRMNFGFLNNVTALFKELLNKKILVFGFIATLLIFGGLFSLWWFYPKASVIIYLRSQKLEENFTIFVSPNISEPDFSDSILPGEIVTKTIEGEKTASATGVKIIGDKASGEVTLYRVGSEITLDSATILKGPNGLDFTLDETVNIASGSAGSPSQVKAKVTALDLGAEYNLASNTTFSVGDYSVSDVEAKNEESFSGGSSREISAVSESDRIKLQESLIDELVQKAVEGVRAEIDSDKLLIEDTVEEEALNVNYSHEVGSEASTLSLEMSIEMKALIVDRNNLASFAGELLEDKVPENFVLRSEQIQSDFDYQGEEDDKYILDVEIDANLLPVIDTDEIKTRIIGRYPFFAEEYLKEEIPGFVRAEIILEPKLPGRLKTLPHVSDNIEIEIASER